MRWARWTPLVLGTFGVVNAALGLLLWSRAVSSPGDDNPAGLFGLVVALVASVPSFGLVLHVRRAPLRRHLLWLVAGVLTAAALAVVFPVVLTLLGVFR